jgi:hypothetical protein
VSNYASLSEAVVEVSDGQRFDGGCGARRCSVIAAERLFLQTGIIGLILPSDVTFTSDSGVFAVGIGSMIFVLCANSYGSIVGPGNPANGLESGNIFIAIRSFCIATNGRKDPAGKSDPLRNQRDHSESWMAPRLQLSVPKETRGHRFQHPA